MPNNELIQALYKIKTYCFMRKAELLAGGAGLVEKPMETPPVKEDYFLPLEPEDYKWLPDVEKIDETSQEEKPKRKKSIKEKLKEAEEAGNQITIEETLNHAEPQQLEKNPQKEVQAPALENAHKPAQAQAQNDALSKPLNKMQLWWQGIKCYFDALRAYHEKKALMEYEYERQKLDVFNKCVGFDAVIQYVDTLLAESGADFS